MTEWKLFAKSSLSTKFYCKIRGKEAEDIYGPALDLLLCTESVLVESYSPECIYLSSIFHQD